MKGMPPAYLLARATRKDLFFEGEKPKIVPNSKGKKRMPGTRKLSDVLKGAGPQLIDLVESNI